LVMAPAPRAPNLAPMVKQGAREVKPLLRR
jgi:hypothetical protein